MKDRNIRVFLVALSLLGTTMSSAGTKVQAADQKLICAKPSFPKQFSGNASWYGEGFDGKKTACGEIFDMNKQTCAHLKLPFQTKVLVEDPKTGKSVVVRVTDRGPYACKRIMDLAKGAARKLGTLSKGVAYIDCTLIDDDDDKS
jgi:rare lipoprotein A